MPFPLPLQPFPRPPVGPEPMPNGPNFEADLGGGPSSAGGQGA